MAGAFPSNLVTGGFRNAYLAKSIGGIAKGKYVLKRYKEDKVNEIKELFGTTEAHSRKVIQMNALARNFAQNSDRERPILEYGATFTYCNVSEGQGKKDTRELKTD